MLNLKAQAEIIPAVSEPEFEILQEHPPEGLIRRFLVTQWHLLALLLGGLFGLLPCRRRRRNSRLHRRPLASLASTLYCCCDRVHKGMRVPVKLGFATGKINHFTSFGLKSLRAATAPPQESDHTIYLPVISK